MTELHWAPQFPIVLLASIFMIIMFIAVRSWATAPRSRAGQLMKSAAVIGLLLILLGPQAEEQDSSRPKPRLVVLVDASQSMALHDVDASGSMSRLNALRAWWLVTPMRDMLGQTMAPTYALISDGYQPVSAVEATSAEPVGTKTPLAESLRQAVQEAGVGGRVLALTDGVDTEVDAGVIRSVASLAMAKSVRVDVALAGGDAPPPDLHLRAWGDPDVVYQGEPSTVRVDAISRGMEGMEADLTVYEGETTNGAIIARRHVQLGMEREFTFPVTPHPESGDGDQTYTVTIETAARGLHVTRSRHVFLDVLEAPVRVLLFDAKPHWETTFFVETLRDDPHIELTTVLALSPKREIVRQYSPLNRRHTGQHASVNMDQLSSFDVIVLGKGVERWFGADRAESLERFVVEDGGALILLRGDPVSTTTDASAEIRRVVQSLAPVSLDAMEHSMRLAVVKEQRTLAEMPDAGNVGAIARALSNVPEMSVTAVETGKARWFVWLNKAPDGRDDLPVVAVGTVGRGRTAASLADGMWRWAMSANDSMHSRSLYSRLWSSMVRWLAMGGEFNPGRALSVRFDTGLRRPDEPVEIIVRSRSELPAPGPAATLRDPNGRVHDLILVRPNTANLKWIASFVPDQQGVYTLTAHVKGREQTSVIAHRAIYDNRRELLDTTPRYDQMRRLANATGGQVWGIDGADHYLSDMREQSTTLRTGGLHEPAWDEPWVFIMVIGALGGAWLLSQRRVS